MSSKTPAAPTAEKFSLRVRFLESQASEVIEATREIPVLLITEGMGNPVDKHLYRAELLARQAHGVFYRVHEIRFDSHGRSLPLRLAGVEFLCLPSCCLSSVAVIFFSPGASLNISQRLHAQAGRHLVVRDEGQIGLRGLQNLTQEVPRARGSDNGHRSLRRRDPGGEAVHDLPDGLW